MGIFNRAGRRTAVAVAALALAAGATLTACGSSDDSSSGSSDSASKSYGDLSVQYSWIKNEEFAGEYYAENNGYYKDAGFSKVTGVSGPSTGVAELLSNKVQVALSDAASVGAAISEQQAPLKIVGATFQKNPFTIVSLKDGANLSTPQSLVGKKIGVDDSNASVFDAFLAANNIDPKSVTVVPGQFNGPQLVEGKQVDGYVAYITNEVIAINNDGFPTTELDFADNNLPYVAETYTVTDDFLKNHKAELTAFLTAEIKGWSDTFKNSTDDTVATIVKHFNAAVSDPNSAEKQNSSGALDPKTTAQGLTGEQALISSPETKANGLFTISKTLQDETVASLKAAGYSVTADQLFDTSIIDSIYKNNPDLKNYGG